MSYRQEQYKRVEGLISEHEIFRDDPGNGLYRGKSYPFILSHRFNNIYTPYIGEIIHYFDVNNVGWWGGEEPTTHPLSSQIACLNHLFPIRNDREAVLAMVRQLVPDIGRVLPITTDSENTVGYIQFEAVSDEDHLNENASTRGSNCTSVDALVYAELAGNRRLLIPIEWKYTEFYGNDDKAAGSKGETRKNRYNALIDSSSQLVAKDNSVYYYEPFYQLMRQTLWAEQMIAHNDSETLQADDFIHIHVIPKENHDLLDKKYPCSGLSMEETWRSCLADQSKYLIVSPKDLLKPIDFQKYAELIWYLALRYWNP